MIANMIVDEPTKFVILAILVLAGVGGLAIWLGKIMYGNGDHGTMYDNGKPDDDEQSPS